jgi:hypothetical protein
MTATTTDLHAYIEDLRATVPYVHPAGRATIDAWLGEMHDAADQDDAATVARLACLVTKKTEQEIEWQRETRGRAISGGIRGHLSQCCDRCAV